MASKTDYTDITTADQLDEINAADVINRSKLHVKKPGEVYLMRGLANVFSRGIDKMADEMRGLGIDAANFSYTQWPKIAADIVTRSNKKKVSYPIIIIGHSLGGNESSKFANYLGERGIKVARIVTFDPVETGVVGKNIRRVTNYYLPKQADNRILAGPGFTGSIKNIDVTVDPDITHTNVEKNPKFQKKTISEIAILTTTKRPLDLER